MKFIAGMDQWVADWVAQRIPGDYTAENFHPCTTIGLMQDGELLAGCIYSNYRKGSKDIELTFASISPRWATQNNIKTFLAYPFLQLGCNRITAIVDARNTKAMRFLKRLGMKCEGNMKEAMDGVNDAVIFGMLFKNCKWFEKELRNGKKISTGTA